MSSSHPPDAVPRETASAEPSAGVPHGPPRRRRRRRMSDRLRTQYAWKRALATFRLIVLATAAVGISVYLASASSSFEMRSPVRAVADR